MRIGPRIGPTIGVQVDATIGMAPPGAATFVGASDVIFDEPNDAVTVEALVPGGVLPGDLLLMVIASSVVFGVPPPAALPTGWSIIAQTTTSGVIGFVTVLRRIAGAEPASHTITLADGLGPAYPVGAVMLAYRGLRADVDAIAIGAVDVLLSGSFACPSLTLTSATDLYLGIVWVSDAAPAVTPPVGTTERFDVSQTSDSLTDRRMEIFEFLKGSTGATGTKTATVAGLHTGVTASVLLRAVT